MFVGLIISFIILCIIIFTSNKASKDNNVARAEQLKSQFPDAFHQKFGYISSFKDLHRNMLREIANTSESELRNLQEAYKKEQERKRKEEEKHRKEVSERYDILQSECPNGVDKYRKLHPGYTLEDCINHEFEIRQIEDEEEHKREVSRKYNLLLSECPNGINEFKTKHPKFTQADCVSHETEIRQIEEVWSNYARIEKKYHFGLQTYIASIPSTATKELVVRNEAIIKHLEEIHDEYKEFNSWYNDHQRFSKESYNKSRELLKKWGRYSYHVDIDGIDAFGNTSLTKFRIWQHFRHAYCNDQNLDYSYCKPAEESRELVKRFVEKSLRYNKDIFDEAMSFIKSLGPYQQVIFADSNQGNAYPDFNEYHFRYLRKLLSDNNIPFSDIGDIDYSKFTYLQHIVVVEFISSNDRLKENCRKIFMEATGVKTCITYLTFLKEFSSEEMSSLIEKTKQKEKERIEKERQEQEHKAAEEARIKAEKERQERVRQQLTSAVSQWNCVPYSTLPYSYIIRYYPMTCEFEATQDEWYDRQLIWSFKNDPEKNSRIPHDDALNELLPRLIGLFESTFGNALSELTLVCIPASSEEKNSARYEEFSELLCGETGMSNAFGHISVSEGRLAKHEGGETGGFENIIIDAPYFNERNIILFDDILTKGQSMRMYASKMSSLGANVIAAVTIGKTCHERLPDYI